MFALQSKPQVEPLCLIHIERLGRGSFIAARIPKCQNSGAKA
jgi:hypothetical protein